MNPKISDIHTDNAELKFTLSGVNVSIANAIRRTILTDIPIAVFRTYPHSANKCNISANTTKMNNEIIKQRLSCIPICISDLSSFDLDNHILELSVNNTTDTPIVVTTNDFKIKNKKSEKYLSDSDTKHIFPPFEPRGSSEKYYTIFTKLPPRISDDIPGANIKLECEFGVGTAKENASFNVVGTCAYGFTPDAVGINTEAVKMRESNKHSEDDIANWRLLGGKRITIKDSFDFVIETVGIYDNNAIVFMGCDILARRLEYIKENVHSSGPGINIMQDPTLQHGFIIEFRGEDYTTMGILAFILYDMYFTGTNQLTFCGVDKPHPHIDIMRIRLAFADENSGDAVIRDIVGKSLDTATNIIRKIGTKFSPNV